MKKLLVLFALCTSTMMVMAQKSTLVGVWQLLDANGRPTNQLRYFLPDGRSIGLSYNSDFTNSSVLFMSDYQMTSDSSFVDHVFYYCNINYQRDILFTFQQENDSVIVTKCEDYNYSNIKRDLLDRWKKTDRPLPVYTDAEWQALHQKSLAEFDRLPSEGQTVEQFAQKLYDKAQDYKKAKKLPQAFEALLVRAELDTTNLKWQEDVYFLFHENKLAPSMAEKIADRYIRLKAAAAPAANDTSVVSAYRNKAYLYGYRGNPGMLQLREMASKAIAMETAAGHQPSLVYGLDYFLIAESYFPEGNFEAVYDNITKCIDILEKVPDVRKMQMGECYMTLAVSLMQTGRKQEGIDVVLNKAIPLMVDENGQPSPKVEDFSYAIVMSCYEELLQENPKDKALLKAYRQFLSDKLIYAVFNSTNKKHNLYGKYIILERNQWTLEEPSATFDDTYILLLKDGEYKDIFKEKDEEFSATMRLEVVDEAVKKDIINQWKAYKKSK